MVLVCVCAYVYVCMHVDMLMYTHMRSWFYMYEQVVGIGRDRRTT